MAGGAEDRWRDQTPKTSGDRQTDQKSASYTEETNAGRIRSLIEKLLSIKVQPESAELAAEVSEETSDTSRSDEAFRRAVFTYEEEHGRFPLLKPKGQAGHDIDSFTHPPGHPDRELIRRIEVKGRNYPWDGDEVVELTARQFRDELDRASEENLPLADAFDYWLYVVEPDETGTYGVIPIRNPASRAAKYQLRGDIWRQLGETS